MVNEVQKSNIEIRRFIITVESCHYEVDGKKYMSQLYAQSTHTQKYTTKEWLLYQLIIRETERVPQNHKVQARGGGIC